LKSSSVILFKKSFLPSYKINTCVIPTYTQIARPKQTLRHEQTLTVNIISNLVHNCLRGTVGWLWMRWRSRWWCMSAITTVVINTHMGSTGGRIIGY